MSDEIKQPDEVKLSRKEKRKLKRKQRAAKFKVVFFPENKKGMHVSRLMNFFRVLVYPIHWLIYPFKMFGPHKIGKGARLYVGNHYCIWDILYPAHTTWEGVHFLAKQSILEAPIMGVCANKVGVIGAMRDGSDIRTLMDSMKALKNGEKVSLFPEGTRNKVSDEEFLPFQSGASLLAIKTKTPIVPFVVYHRPRVFRMTHVVFGEAFELSEYYDRKLTQEEYDEADLKIRQKLYEIRDSHRAYLQSKKKKSKKSEEKA